ncbi:MAG: PilZ domain-containing protein [Candidatus Omnitrophica bacterium]|nr:PilZ domain-containing protein [Candidatus Omnitrophota bacterium]
MKIKIRKKNNVAILDIEGNIDINSSKLVETVGWVLNNKTTKIICNFDGVNLIDYVGISLISVIYKNVLNHSGELNLYAVPAHVRRLFAVVGLDRVFKYHIFEKDALRAFEEENEIPKESKGKLRRKFKRVESSKIIEFKPKLDGKSKFYKGTIINLSAVGMFVKTNKVFSLGEILETHMNLSPELNKLILDTKVVWVSDKEMQSSDYPGMGLEFHDITSEIQQEIMKSIEDQTTYFSQD